MRFRPFLRAKENLKNFEVEQLHAPDFEGFFRVINFDDSKSKAHHAGEVDQLQNFLKFSKSLKAYLSPDIWFYGVLNHIEPSGRKNKPPQKSSSCCKNRQKKIHKKHDAYWLSDWEKVLLIFLKGYSLKKR